MRQPIYIATVLILALATAPAFARNVQRAECVGPAGAPVKAIYLHGWFQPRGTSKQEAGNRNQIEQLAKELGIRIAIPLAPDINPENGNREWPYGTGAPAINSLRAIEAQASRVCGAPLAPQRSLIGFSNGGYAARNIAMSCDEHLKNNYSNVIMMGAKAWPNPPDRNFAGCPKLTAMAGTGDDLKSCAEGRGCRSFHDVAADMRRGMGGNVQIETYKGGHELASNDRLAQLIGRPGRTPTVPAPAPTPAPVASGRPPAVSIPPMTGGTQFILTLPGATK